MQVPFMNARRLRDYPRLIAVAAWGVMIINAIFGQGWFGRFGGILSYDFLTLYSAGFVFRYDINNLYDVPTLAQVEEQMFQPSSLQGGVNRFSSPPFVAMIYSPFSLLKYGWAFALWTILSLLLAIGAAVIMQRYLISHRLNVASITSGQMIVLVLSFFPVLIGIYWGQNNILTLFLMVVTIYLLPSKHPFWAGVIAGLLIYKPHFVIGLLIVWLVWKQWKVLAGFCLTACLIAGSFLFFNGIDPYLAYLHYGNELMYLAVGAPGMETTIFALIASVLPETMLPSLWVINLGFIGLVGGFLGWIAYRASKGGKGQDLVLGIAVLFPFLTAPHTLLYDLVLLIPALLLYSRSEFSRTTLWIGVALYLGIFLVTAISNLLGVSLLALLPIGLTIFLIRRLLTDKTPNAGALAGTV